MLEAVKKLYEANLNQIEALIAQKDSETKQEIARNIAEAEKAEIAQHYKELDDAFYTWSNKVRADAENQIVEKQKQVAVAKADYRTNKINEITGRVTAQFVAEVKQLHSEKNDICNKLGK